MGRDRLEHLERTLDVSAQRRGCGGDLVGVRHRTRRCGNLRCVASSKPTRSTTGGCGSPTRSAQLPKPPSRSHWTDDGVADLLADLNQVREGFERFGLLDDRVRFLQGRFDETLPDAPIERLALLRIGGGVGAEAGVVLEHLYDRLTTGAYVVIEDDVDPACHDAINAFRAGRGVVEPIERVGLAGVAWRKCRRRPPRPTRARRTGDRAATRAPRRPLRQARSTCPSSSSSSTCGGKQLAHWRR